MLGIKNNQFVQAIAVVLLLVLAFLLKAVLVTFFVAFLITTFLYPLVRWLRARHVPNGLAVLLPILGLIIVVAGLVYFVSPQIAQESRQFSNNVPTYLNQLKQHGIDIPVDTNSVKTFVQDHFGAISDVVLAATKTVTEAVIGIVSIIVVTIYWLGSYEKIQKTLLSYVPARSRQRLSDIWARIEKKLASWIIAQVLLGIVVGLMVWIGALIIGLPFAGILGLISGVLEIIPTLGPIAAAIPGVLLGLSISWETALAALILYIAIQQIENHLLAPVLLGRTVHLSPIIVIFSLLVGATLDGIMGALLAVPVALVVSAFVDSYRDGGPKLKLNFKPSSRKG